METSEVIKVLESNGGKLWEKGEMRRVYFDYGVILSHAGLDTGHYNTGNISSATLKGEKISNSEAKRIIGAFVSCKFWYDVNDGSFYHKDIYGDYERSPYRYMAKEFFAAIKALIA